MYRRCPPLWLKSTGAIIKGRLGKGTQHRRRQKTEEKTKVDAVVWGTELIKFNATQSYFAPE